MATSMQITVLFLVVYFSPRVKFMLETLSALKTNNARKIPNYDPSVLEHMKKLLRNLVRSSGKGGQGSGCGPVVAHHVHV